MSDEDRVVSDKTEAAPSGKIDAPRNADLPGHGEAQAPGETGQRPRATGADRYRGPLKAGDKVQLTDPKGRMHTITLAPGGTFHTHRGYLRHDDLIGRFEGSVATNTSGIEYLALRPLLSDYVLSMPRGAAIVYPKDAGQIVTMADIFPGARVVEAGVGSGALALSLLRAVGDGGTLHSVERRADFADIARANVEIFFGGAHPAWHLHVGDLADVLPRIARPGEIDRVVLDMLAPWENLDAAATALAPGGVLVAYVATTTQLSRLAEDARADGRFAEPQAWESMVRSWHLEGLAVRPEHRMVGHSGFLLTTRRLADGVAPPPRVRRPAKGAYPADLGWGSLEPGDDGPPGAVGAGRAPGGAAPAEAATPPGPTSLLAGTSLPPHGLAPSPRSIREPAGAPGGRGLAGAPGSGTEWTAGELGERPISERRVRRVRRNLMASHALPQGSLAEAGGATPSDGKPRT